MLLMKFFFCICKTMLHSDVESTILIFIKKKFVVLKKIFLPL
jgi:hypothetical protein